MARTLDQVDMDKIVSLCKRRGFIFPSSEIYGGLGSTWDYGPLGVELKRNVKDAWWKAVVHRRDDMVGLDAAILMHPQTWVASGHAETFTDPLVECKECHQRFRADHIVIYEVFGQKRQVDPWDRLGLVSYVGKPEYPPESAENEETRLLQERGYSHYKSDIKTLGDFPDIGTVPCPNPECQTCGSLVQHKTYGSLTEPRQFNLMLKTFLGPVEDSASQVWLRPETAQGIFVNFQNVLVSTRRKLPFGIAQIGKAFRNEITPGNFVFRTREFEQMEIEFFVKPGTDEEWHQRWLKARFQWYIDLGIREENLRIRQHGQDELAHYAKSCHDIEYRFPWGWAELEGIANRTDFDLRQHQQHSGQDMTYFDDQAQERYLPYVIEPSGGADRATLAFLIDAYDDEPDLGNREVRTILHLHPALAPVKVAVLPLSRNARLVPKAQEVYYIVQKHFVTQYDDAQSIGRRYRRQDEIGTPLAVTVDFQTIDEDNAVTIRDRDTMQQLRVPISDLLDTLTQRLNTPS